MNFLSSLQSEVKVIDRSDTLDIEVVTPDDEDYKYILRGREERKLHPENYGHLSDIDWN